MSTGVHMQTKKSGKFLFTVLLVAAIAFIALIYFMQSNSPPQNDTTAAIGETDSLSPPVSTASPERTIFEKDQNQDSTLIPTKKDSFFGDPADEAEITQWYAKRGKFISAEGEAEYLSYDQGTLEKLAVAGDIRAMQMLAKLYLDRDHFQQYGFDAAKKQYWNAAVHGSSEALIALANLEKTTAFDLATDEADRRSKALEVLALYRAAELRGDLWSPSNQVPVFKEMNHINLSDIENVSIDQQASKIVNDLQQQRNIVGLNDFDNSMPESVVKFFDKIKNKNM